MIPLEHRTAPPSLAGQFSPLSCTQATDVLCHLLQQVYVLCIWAERVQKLLLIYNIKVIS